MEGCSLIRVDYVVLWLFRIHLIGEPGGSMIIRLPQSFPFQPHEHEHEHELVALLETWQVRLPVAIPQSQSQLAFLSRNLRPCTPYLLQAEGGSFFSCISSRSWQRRQIILGFQCSVLTTIKSYHETSFRFPLIFLFLSQSMSR